MRNIYDGFDYSTIDLAILKRMGQYSLPNGKQLSSSWGAGCFMDPPGYPTYFLRSVYTRSGNNPEAGPTEVFDYFGALYVTRRAEDWKHIPVGTDVWDYIQEQHADLMRNLWNPLPIDHQRVQFWIRRTMSYFRNCYSKDGDDRNVSNMVRFGPPDYHLGYICVKYFYPDVTIEIVSLENSGAYGRNTLGIGDWIEREAVQPTPDRCWPTNGRMDDSGWCHAQNGSWCQYCGWYEGER